MKKADFIALGLDEALAQKCEEASLKELGEYVSKADAETWKNDAERLKGEVKTRDKQLEDLKKDAAGNEALQKSIAELQATNESERKAHESAMSALRIDIAVERALTSAKAKNLTAAKALLNLQDAKLADDGTIVGLSEQIEKMKANEATKFLYADEAAPPSFQGFQPGASAGTPNAKAVGFEARLSEARKANNMVEVIKIKQEAAQEGVALM